MFWVGHPSPQWLPLDQLSNAKALLQDYYDQQALTIPEDVQNFLSEEPTLAEQLGDPLDESSSTPTADRATRELQLLVERINNTTFDVKLSSPSID